MHANTICKMETVCCSRQRELEEDAPVEYTEPFRSVSDVRNEGQCQAAREVEAVIFDTPSSIYMSC